MAKIIPNENSWIGFTTTAPADSSAPTEDEIAAAADVTPFVVQLNASSTGNTIPTPSLDSLFDRMAQGTVQGTFTADMYRDDSNDSAWETLPRGTDGYFLVSRFGGTGVSKAPQAGQNVEVWPVIVTSRTGSAMTSNTVQTFTVTGAVHEPPVENAVVTAGSGVPSAPLNASATASATPYTAVVDWDVPASVGSSAITSYDVYRSATKSGSYIKIVSDITKLGTTATLVDLASGINWFKVSATNSQGESELGSAVSATIASA